MKKFTLYFSIISLVFFISSFTLIAQQKDLDKIKSLIDKGKMEKAQEHCDKVTQALAYKKAVRFFNLMALGYYNHKDYEKAAEMLLKGDDKKLALKLAKDYEKTSNDFYDLNMAAKLYHKGEQHDKAAGIFFGQGKFEDAAAACNTPDCSRKFGDSLLNMGKMNEALLFYKHAKRKGELFDNETVLNYYYQKRDYGQAYAIQNYKEGDFKMHIQGSVIDKMFENKEKLDFVKNFLDSLGIKSNKQDEVIIEAYLNAKQFDNAIDYCLAMKDPNQKIALSFLADKAAGRFPEVSANANLKLGRSTIAFNQLGTYLIEAAKQYNDKWTEEPIDKKLLAEYSTNTKPSVQKTGKEYCEILSHATSLSKVKADELAKTNETEAAIYSKVNLFLKQVGAAYCKK